MFDTQIAATLLGLGDQLSYSALVTTLLGVELGPSMTRTDWRQRPLGVEQLVYAASDVIYLSALYQQLNKALAEQDLLLEFQQRCVELTLIERYQPQPELAWRRVKGIQRLRGAKIRLAKSLAAWREREAVSQNVPRRWLLGDNELLQLCYRQPSTGTELKQVRGLYGRFRKRYGEQILAIITAFLDENATDTENKSEIE